MLRCARIGAMHSVVFGGFSANALQGPHRGRRRKMVITADGGFAGRRTHRTEARRRQGAREGCATVQTRHRVPARRAGRADMHPGRDIWWHEAVEGRSTHCEPEWVDAEHPLFLLYTSGSTGKPKGIQHASAAAIC